MDSFERWSHWDPDRGNGSLEAVVLIGVIVLVLFVPVVLSRYRLHGLWQRSRPRPAGKVPSEESGA